MDPYGNAANQYGQEMMAGTRLQAGLDQQQAEMPNQLFDRFMSAYQQQVKQKMLQQQMARQQMHEDTYQKAEQAKEARDRAAAIGSASDDVYNQYTGDPAQKEMLKSRLVAAGMEPTKADAMFPQDKTVVPDQGQKIGSLNGQDITLPETSADIQNVPGMGGGYKAKVDELKRKAAYDKAREDQAAAALKERENFGIMREDRRDARQEALFGQQSKMMAAKQSHVNVNIGGAPAKTAEGEIDPVTDRQADEIAVSGKVNNIPRGQAGAAIYAAAYKRFVEKYPGKNPGTVAADYAAQAGSQKGLQKMSDAVQAFEGLANQNFDQLVEAAKKIPDVGIPVINSLTRKAKKDVGGDPDVNSFEQLRQTTLTEVARVVNNPNLTGILSDSARHEIESLLSPGATLRQVVAARDVFKNEMARRSGTMKQQIGTVRGQIASGANPASAASPDDASSMQEGTISKSGKYIWRSGAWVAR